MKTHILIGLLTLPALMGSVAPEYDSRDTQELILKMIKAHGGMEKWAKAPTLSYEHEMTDPSKPDDPWTSYEVHQQGSRRSYHTWPLDEATLVNDGKEIWSVGWKRGNPPSMMAKVSYFFINLPWITQDGITKLEAREDTRVDVIEEGKVFKTVRLTFKGSSEHEYFDLYIDPDSYLLKGVKYTVTDKALMKAFRVPEDTKFLGPLTKVYKEYTDVEGLKLVSRYDTYRPNGKQYGIHTVKKYSLEKPFDESRLRKPSNAVTEQSD